jgi:two-component system heavy metal sensor histidine kinase CusS
MSREIEHIHAGELHTRLSTQRWPSELNVLSASFDGMMTRLEASFTQLTRFSSDIAHELRGPINNLISAASVTQSKARSAEEYRDTLAAIVEEGERLSRMISSMLFLARADNSREPLHLERLTSATEFARQINLYDVLAEEKNITLISEGEVDFYADPIHLQRALSNLLSNALRHTPPAVKLCCAPGGKMVRLCSASKIMAKASAPNICRIFSTVFTEWMTPVATLRTPVWGWRWSKPLRSCTAAG